MKVKQLEITFNDDTPPAEIDHLAEIFMKLMLLSHVTATIRVFETEVHEFDEIDKEDEQA